MPNQIEVAPSSKVEIKVPLVLGQIILRELARPPNGYYERVVLALAGLSKTDGKDAVTVHSVHQVPDESYIPTDDGTSWNQKFTAEIASEGMRQNLGVLILHKHGFSSNPSLSSTDRTSFAQTLSRLRILLPHRPHGSVVLGKDYSMGGLIWLPGNESARQRVFRIKSVTWLGTPLITWPRTERRKIPHRQMYERQITLLGEGGQAEIADGKVGIVGLGGGGSHVVQQLAHAGFGNFILVDSDVVEVTNLHRLVGSQEKDVRKIEKKTMVMSRLIQSINKRAQVKELQEEFPTERSIEALKESDIIFSCVDTYKARVPLADFAWRHEIPIIDIGIGTQVEREGASPKLTRMTGHVHVYVPGGPCMWCSGLLSKERLDEESQGRGPEYVQGVQSPAQIVSANGVVASLAVTEAMQLITGFMHRTSAQPVFRIYDAVNSRLYAQEINSNPECSHCASSLGLGDTSW